jgi:hypothetical protein
MIMKTLDYYSMMLNIIFRIPKPLHLKRCAYDFQSQKTGSAAKSKKD